MRNSWEEGKPGGLEAQPAPPHCGRGPLCQPGPTPHLPSAWSLGSWFPDGCVCSRDTPICWQSEGRVWGCQARHPTASSMASPHSPAPDSSPLPCRSPPVPASLEGTLRPPPHPHPPTPTSLLRTEGPVAWLSQSTERGPRGSLHVCACLPLPSLSCRALLGRQSPQHTDPASFSLAAPSPSVPTATKLPQP